MFVSSLSQSVLWVQESDKCVVFITLLSEGSVIPSTQITLKPQKTSIKKQPGSSCPIIFNIFVPRAQSIFAENIFFKEATFCCFRFLLFKKISAHREIIKNKLSWIFILLLSWLMKKRGGVLDWSVMRVLLPSVLMKIELSQKIKLSLHWPVY